MKTELEIQNLKCGGCSNTIRKKLGYPAIEDSNTFGKRAKSYVSCALGRI